MISDTNTYAKEIIQINYLTLIETRCVCVRFICKLAGYPNGCCYTFVDFSKCTMYLRELIIV